MIILIIKTIKIMNEHINEMNSMDRKFDFIPKSYENIKVIEDIKNFGEIIPKEKIKYIYQIYQIV